MTKTHIHYFANLYDSHYLFLFSQVMMNFNGPYNTNRQRFSGISPWLYTYIFISIERAAHGNIRIVIINKKEPLDRNTPGG